MTVLEAINSVELLRGGYLSYDEKKRALSRLEALLMEGGFSGFQSDSQTLSLPDEFCDIYILYLKAEAENKMEEYERCNNTLITFMAQLSDYKRHAKRTGGYKAARFKLR